jgi:hypothetical protein
MVAEPRRRKPPLLAILVAGSPRLTSRSISRSASEVAAMIRTSFSVLAVRARGAGQEGQRVFFARAYRADVKAGSHADQEADDEAHSTLFPPPEAGQS